MRPKIIDGKLFAGNRELSPLQTKFCKILHLENISVVLEDYYKFEGSNVYAILDDGTIVWKAERVVDADVYVGINFADGDLFAISWYSHCCRLDASNGKILDRKLTK